MVPAADLCQSNLRHFGLLVHSSHQLQPMEQPIPLGAAHRLLPLPSPVLAATLSDFDKALFFLCTCCTLRTPMSGSNLQHISQVGRGIYPSDRQRGAEQLVQSTERVCKLAGTQPRPELVPQLLAHTACLLAAAGDTRWKGEQFVLQVAYL